ncbi:MAG: ATP-binding protein [Lautropia sp.]
MTLRQRVLLRLLVIAPAVWLLAIVAAWLTTRHEVDEFYDTQQLKLGQQVLSMLSVLPAATPAAGVSGAAASGMAASGAVMPGGAPGVDRPSRDAVGDADPGEMAIAAWTLDGRLLTVPDPDVSLPFERERTGFVTRRIGGNAWRIHYLVDARADRVIAVGGYASERDEVLRNLVLSHLVPWLLSLPVLLFAISAVLRRELRPIHVLASDLSARAPNDLHPVPPMAVPSDIAPVLSAMNALFGRIGAALEHERRLTADAAHELRTPIAALQAQWDALGLARGDEDRARASANITASIGRLSRLVGQLLSLSAVESDSLRRSFAPVDWHRVVGNAVGDVLPLIEGRGADVSVEWPQDGVEPLPLRGDEALLGMMLRNLVDNAIRHSPVGSRVVVRVAADALSVLDDGPGIAAETAARLGERFVRASGQPGAGSGIGISIVLRIASLHDLSVAFLPAAGHGLEVLIRARPGARRPC